MSCGALLTPWARPWEPGLSSNGLFMGLSVILRVHLAGEAWGPRGVKRHNSRRNGRDATVQQNGWALFDQSVDGDAGFGKRFRTQSTTFQAFLAHAGEPVQPGSFTASPTLNRFGIGLLLHVSPRSSRIPSWRPPSTWPGGTSCRSVQWHREDRTPGNSSI
jgi:hypothetical protein